MLRMDISNSAVSLWQFFFVCKECQTELSFVFPELRMQTLRYRASGKDVEGSRFTG